MKSSIAAIAAVSLLLTGLGGAQGGSVNGSLSITTQPGSLALTLTPASASMACNAASGTLVSQAGIIGGSGNPVTYSMTGNLIDFVINATTGAITVAAGGIHPADCNSSFTNVVTATQP